MKKRLPRKLKLLAIISAVLGLVLAIVITMLVIKLNSLGYH